MMSGAHAACVSARNTPTNPIAPPASSILENPASLITQMSATIAMKVLSSNVSIRE